MNADSKEIECKDKGLRNVYMTEEEVGERRGVRM
jgi:hypothetical protein